MASFRQSVLSRGASQEDLNSLTDAELVDYNPLLADYTPTTRLAYAKFKSFTSRGASFRPPASMPEVEDVSFFEEVSETTASSSSRTTSSLKKMQDIIKKTSSVASLNIPEEIKTESKNVNTTEVHFERSQEDLKGPEVNSSIQSPQIADDQKTSRQQLTPKGAHQQAVQFPTSPKIYPEQHSPRILAGIHGSPSASHLMNLQLSPLPSRDIPTTKESLKIPYADDSSPSTSSEKEDLCLAQAEKSPRKETPEKKTPAEDSALDEDTSSLFSPKRKNNGAGKSVITGHVRTGWL
jgi:hypothetical protein